ncbi:MAG: hypothetical protein IKX99_02635, partial [Lachnospiraceae bacterium]|nr:hypothetical protein [Lachnospiraceae bacterium]
MFKLYDRINNGEVTEIEVEVNGTTGTFEIDEFSTYTLTYKDTMIEETDDSPKTGDRIMVWVMAM